MLDEEIIALYFAREEEALLRTDEKYRPYCGSIAYAILHDTQDRDEVLSDTWLAAWNSIPPQMPQVLRLFLARITRTLSFNRYAASHAKKRGGGQMEAVLEELRECAAGTTDVESDAIAHQLEESIRAFIDTLPPRDGSIFLRRYFYVESVSDIAKRYSLSPTHVSVILNRTRKKLRAQLIKEGYLYE